MLQPVNVFTLEVYFEVSLVQLSILCCDDAIFMLWLGLGKETNWLWLGKDHISL